MKTRNFLTSAAVAVVMAASGVANAQLLGGGASGGLGGSITGGLGSLDATGNGSLNGSLNGSTDAVGRTRDVGSRAAGRLKGTAASARGQAEAAAEGAEATASGALDAGVDTAADATNAASATADAAGDAGGNVAVTTDDVSAAADGNANGNGSGSLDLGAPRSIGDEPIVDGEPSPRRERQHPRREAHGQGALEGMTNVSADPANPGVMFSGEGSGNAKVERKPPQAQGEVPAEQPRPKAQSNKGNAGGTIQQ